MELNRLTKNRAFDPNCRGNLAVRPNILRDIEPTSHTYYELSISVFSGLGGKKCTVGEEKLPDNTVFDATRTGIA